MSRERLLKSASALILMGEVYLGTNIASNQPSQEQTPTTVLTPEAPPGGELHPSQEKILAEGKEKAMQIPGTRIVVSTARVGEAYWKGLRKYQNELVLAIAGAKAKMGRPLDKSFNPDDIPTPNDTVFLGKNEADEKKFATSFEKLFRDLNASAQKTSYMDQNGNIVETSLKGENPYIEVLFYTQDSYVQDPETPKVLFSQKVDYWPNQSSPHTIRQYNAEDNVLRLYIILNNSDGHSSFSSPLTQHVIKGIEWGFVKDAKSMKNYEKRGGEFTIKYACGYEYNPNGFQTGIIGPTNEKVLYRKLFPELKCLQ